VVNQRLAGKLMARRGHRVSIAETGTQALSAWETGHFDLIFMDVMMPEMDGIEATRRIRELEQGRGKHVPIIAMTANAMQGDRAKCLEAGMGGYVSKPIVAEQLDAEMARVLGRHVPLLTVKEGLPATDVDKVYDRAEALARLDHDEALLQELIGLFMQDAPQYLREIEVAWQAADWLRLGRVAHTLKGLLATFSAGPAHAAATALERAAMAPDVESLTALVEQTRTEARRFLAIVGGENPLVALPALNLAA